MPSRAAELLRDRDANEDHRAAEDGRGRESLAQDCNAAEDRDEGTARTAVSTKVTKRRKVQRLLARSATSRQQ